jgi:putative toxin-antitoxin system antitoxin component (TIGR02293 family)
VAEDFISAQERLATAGQLARKYPSEEERIAALKKKYESDPFLAALVKATSSATLFVSERTFRRLEDLELSRTWVEANLPEQEIAEIQQLASQIFEDPKAASEWLQTPNLATYNKPPVSLLGTPEGLALVENLLRRIETGNLA